MHISISVDGYKEKPKENEIPTIPYLRRNFELDRIADSISTGHAISANFTTNSETIVTQKKRKGENFVSTCYVMLDLDGDINQTLQELNISLSIKPTICYTTYRHQTEGLGNRYRLLYFFKEPIKSIPLYQTLYDHLTSKNKLHLNDNCGRNCTQQTFGTYFTNKGYSLINNDILYSVKDILGTSYESVITADKEKKAESIMQCNDTFKNPTLKRKYVIQDNSFLNDYATMSISNIIDKYSNVYANIQETPLPYTDEDTPYILYPADYCCIQRRWYPYQVLNQDGGVITATTRIRKIRDGEHRRYKLFLNGILRRFITNDTISYDNLLFNLLYEFYHFYVRTDISKHDIKTIANNVWNANLTNYKKLKGTNHKYKINHAYCLKHDIRPQKAKQIAARQLNSQRIGELYDCLLTDKENLQVFSDNGLNVSLSTLKRWRKENGISKYQRLPA